MCTTCLDTLNPALVDGLRFALASPDAPSLVAFLDSFYAGLGRLVEVFTQPDGATVFAGGNDPAEAGPDSGTGNLYVELRRTDAGWRLADDYTDYTSGEEADAAAWEADTLYKLVVIDEENAEHRAATSTASALSAPSAAQEGV